MNVNNQELISVNTHLLSMHSDYFKSLFAGSFIERDQAVIPIHLPSKISIESFRHLTDLLTNTHEVIQSDRIADLFHLCDEYLFDYLPYRLVAYVLDQFVHGHVLEIVDMASKPNLVSSLIRACFSHLLSSQTNVSTDIFGKFLLNHSDELRKLIQLFLHQKCWFDEQFLS